MVLVADSSNIVDYAFEPRMQLVGYGDPVQTFAAKYASEWQVLTFDFTNALLSPNLLVNVLGIVVTCSIGNDPDPQAILLGAPSINSSPITKLNGAIIAVGNAVSQAVKGGVPGATYVIEVNCGTNQQYVQPTCAGVLPILTP